MSIIKTLRGLKGNFWLSSIMQLFEKWAWYGVFSLLGLYLVESTDKGGLGFTHVQKGNIIANVAAILYFLPIFCGVIADRIGYKKTMVMSFIVMAIGYYFLWRSVDYVSVYLSFLMVAVGGAFFKPVSSAIVARSTDESNGALAFGVFYMLLNIGGFFGSGVSSYLRTEYGWGLIFVQSVVISLVLLGISIIFYKEEVIKQEKDSILGEINKSVLNLLGALKDAKLIILLIIMVGYWTVFNQLFYTLPNFIQDWVDSSDWSLFINDKVPFLYSTLVEDGQVKAEWFLNLDSFFVIFFQVLVSFLLLRMTQLNAIIRGGIVLAIGSSLTVATNNVFFTFFGMVLFSFGEMMSAPTISSYVAQITPMGKDALYQGTTFLPVAAGSYFAGFITGDLYQSWSDKFSLLKRTMAERGIKMPNVVSHDEYVKEAASKLGMRAGDLERQFDLSADIKWSEATVKIAEFGKSKGIDMSGVDVPFSKNDYFEMAQSKLGMNNFELTQYLWNTYSPNKIWYVVFGVGMISIIGLYVYDRLVIKNREE